MNDKKDKEKEKILKTIAKPELFKQKEDNEKFDDNEIESDGSASAFSETEGISDDNFDDLNEK